MSRLPFGLLSYMFPESPKERYVWTRVRILHETDKALLVFTTRRLWIPKSRIFKIRLKNNTFEIYAKESSIR